MSRISCRLSEKMSYCAINMIINVIYTARTTNGSPGDSEVQRHLMFPVKQLKTLCLFSNTLVVGLIPDFFMVVRG